MDYLIDFIFKIHYNTKELTYGHGGGDVGNKIKIGEMILKYLQNWKIIFENQQQLQYVEKKSKLKIKDLNSPIIIIIVVKMMILMTK